MKITLDKRDKIWEAISICILMCNAALLAISMPGLPDVVPIHFSGSGVANGFGSKHTLWLIFAISIPMYVFLTWLSFNPQFHKNRMTENNMEEQKRLTSKMARTVKAFILLVFFIISIFMVQTAQGNWTKLFPYLFIVIFGLIIPPCLYYVVKISNVQSQA